MADGIYHTLAADEDLVYLAEYYYGDSGGWDHIYYANEDLIGDDPEAVTAGMRLFVPALETRRAVAILKEGEEDRKWVVHYRGPRNRARPVRPAYGGPPAFPGTEWRFENHERSEIPYAGYPASKYHEATAV
jgi:hypothetical protein